MGQKELVDDLDFPVPLAILWRINLIEIGLLQSYFVIK